MTCGSHEEIQSVHSWSFWLFLVKVWRAYLRSFFPHPVKIPIPETTISSRGHLKLTAAKARLEQGMLLGHSEHPEVFSAGDEDAHHALPTATLGAEPAAPRGAYGISQLGHGEQLCKGKQSRFCSCMFVLKVF